MKPDEITVDEGKQRPDPEDHSVRGVIILEESNGFRTIASIGVISPLNTLELLIGAISTIAANVNPTLPDSK